MKISMSGLVMALYIVTMFFSQSFSFGQYQIRIATALYVLAAPFPWLVIPLSLANMLSNILFGGFGMIDAIGGLIVGLLTTLATRVVGKRTTSAFWRALPTAVIPSLIAPIWLSYLLNVNYLVLVASLIVGQVISAYTVGLILLKLDLPQKINTIMDHGE